MKKFILDESLMKYVMYIDEIVQSNGTTIYGIRFNICLIPPGANGIAIFQNEEKQMYEILEGYWFNEIFGDNFRYFTDDESYHCIKDVDGVNAFIRDKITKTLIIHEIEAL